MSGVWGAASKETTNPFLTALETGVSSICPLFGLKMKESMYLKNISCPYQVHRPLDFPLAIAS